MSAFIIIGLLSLDPGNGVGAPKRAVLSATGTASYDTNGRLIDLSSVNTVLTGLDPMAAFNRVDAVNFCGVNPHGSDIYRPAYVRAASGAPATGTIKVRDLSAASDAEIASTTDIHTTTFFLEVIGT